MILPHSKSVLYFSPHQDDELLSMGIDICNSISKGQDVHVILCTDGSKCSVIKQLADGKECNKHAGTHKYQLSEEEFITARDKEFLDSCRALGVKDCNVHIPERRFVDRKLTVCNSKETILHYLFSLGQDCVICTFDPNHENKKQHRDHKALGYAAVELFNEGFISEMRLFTESYYPECFHHDTDFVRSKAVSVIDTASAAILEKLKKAAASYSRWEPEAGRYAIGYHDIAKAFDGLLENGRSYCNVFEQATFVPFESADTCKCRKLIVSLASGPGRIHSIPLLLETISKQRVTPDAVVLWLKPSDFPNKEEDLPEELIKMKSENNLWIRWREEDFTSQSNNVRAVKEYQDALVITVDDDISYNDQITENMYRSYLLHPKEVSAASMRLLVNSLHNAKYTTLRVDIVNKGNEVCNVLEQSVTPAPVFIRRPTWLPNGITIESVSGKMKMSVKCVGNGTLEIHLLGRDMRNAEGKRYPVWIDCTWFAVNGETVFNGTKTVCHDKRYVYRKAVEDGEVVRFDVTWSECRSNHVLDELHKLQQAKAEAVKKMAEAQQSLKKKQKETAKAKQELKNVKSGWSYKIGRVITWLPRKIKCVLKKNL